MSWSDQRPAIAAHDGQRLLGSATAVLSGFRLFDVQLGMLATLPMDDKHDLSSGLVDVSDDLRDQGPHQPLACSHRRLWCIPSRGEVVAQSREVRMRAVGLRFP